MCLTGKIFLQTHVTFCEYLVFHEFKRNLYITLAEFLEQEGIANLLFSICLYIHHHLLSGTHSCGLKYRRRSKYGNDNSDLGGAATHAQSGLSQA